MSVVKSTTRSKPVKITHAVLVRYQELQAKRQALQRQVDNLATEQKQIVDAAYELAKAELGRKFGPGRSVEAFGFNIVIGTGPRRVAWKEEFVARLGEGAADAVQQAVIPPLTVSIHKPGADQS